MAGRANIDGASPGQDASTGSRPRSQGGDYSIPPTPNGVFIGDFLF